jgi:hypothetical protein
LGQAKIDLSTAEIIVRTETRGGVQTTWLITAKLTGEESVTIRVPVGRIDGP